MSFDPAKQYPAGGEFAAVSKEFAKGGWDASAADLDAVEVPGGGYFGSSPSVLVYWGASDQHSWGFGQIAYFNGTMQQYLQTAFN